MADNIEEAMARASERQRQGHQSDEELEDEEQEEPSETPQQTGPERRYIDGRWLCYYGDDKFVEFVDNEWKSVPSDTNVEELKQKWEQIGPTQPSSSAGQTARCVVNGVSMVWNPLGKTWIPDVDVNEDFLANYHSQYGIPFDYSSIPAPQPSVAVEEKPAPLTKAEKRAKKREAAAAEAERLKGWIQMDETMNTKVYVSGLPTTITEEQFIELMSKYGIIMEDPRTSKPKVKLYRDEEGNLKGDGICCYVKVESVHLALQLLDGLRYDDNHTINVDRAHFEIKGQYDPKKKKARLTAVQKKRFLENQNKAFEWQPEKARGYRPICECTVVLKGMFTLDEIDQNAALILDLKEEMKELYSKFGALKNVTVYDSNPEGVITLTYENVEASDLAVKSLNGIIRHGRTIQAYLWDGKEKFKRVETAEERRRRENAWEEFLGNEEHEEAETET